MLNDKTTASLSRFLLGEKARSVVEATEVKGSLAVGTILDVWRVEELIGFGGSAEVYRVVRVDTNETAALKILVDEDARTRKRFVDEIDILSQNTLPQLPRLIARGEWEGRPYFVLELLEPVDVPSDEKSVERYILSVCASVRAIHLSGIIHRDLKPKNIMRRANGEVVLIDLGLSKSINDSTWPRNGVSVVSGKVVGMGTPGFAAPEQLTGGEISVAVDIHALGRIVNSAFKGDVPRSWEAIVRRATSSIPEQRYGSVSEFATAIRTRNRVRHVLIGGVLAACVAAGMIFFGGRFAAFRQNQEILPREVSIAEALGEADRVWETGGEPSFEGEDVAWRVGGYGSCAGRETYVASGGGGFGCAKSYLRTRIKGPCRIRFDYRIVTYKGDAIVSCDRQELLHFNDIADDRSTWNTATFEIAEGEHVLEFVYRHPGQGFVNRFNGFMISDFKILSNR